MLDVLVTLMSEALKKIFDVSVDKVAGKMSEKRSLAVAFIELYDAIEAVEESSRSALHLFQNYYNGAVPLRISARSAMEALVSSVDTFDKKLRSVYSKLRLYNPHLATVLQDHLFGKTHTIEVVNALLAAAPRIKMDGNYPTDLLIIPTALPDRALLGTTHASESRTEVEQKISTLKEQIDKSLKKREIDFSSREEVALVLRNGELNLRGIEAGRRELAEFIKQNVPLSEILP